MATSLYLLSTKASNWNRWRFNDLKFVSDQALDRGHTYTLGAARGNGVYTASMGTFQDYAGDGTFAIVTKETGNIAYWFISPPLSAGVTISGTITFNIWAHEDSMSANAAMTVQVFKVNSIGEVTLIVKQNRATELGTSQSAQNWTATGYTNQTLAKGDRLLVVLGYCSPSGASMASGYNVYTSFNGNSAGADGDSYVTFTETLSFMSSPSPAGTKAYLTDDASDVTALGADVACKKMWTDRGASVQTALLRNMNSLDAIAPDPRYDRLTESTISSEGPNYCQVGENVADTAGSSWTNPGYVTADDGNRATNYVTVGGQGYTLRMRDFQFQNPIGRLMGAKWEIEGHTQIHNEGYTDQQAAIWTTSVNAYPTFPLTTDTILNLGQQDSYGNYVAVAPGATPAKAKSSTDWKADWLNDYNFQGQTYYVDFMRCTVWYAKYMEWYTPSLAAFTLADWIRIVISGLETSPASTHMTLAAEIAVVDLDGSEVAIFGHTAGTQVLNDSTETAVTIDIAGADISVSEGQRIRIRVGIAAYELAANFYLSYPNQTFYYAGTSDGGSGDCSVTFTQTLSELKIDAASAYLDVQASSVEERESADAATSYVDFVASGTDVYEELSGYNDAAIVALSLTPASVEVVDFVESATVYEDLVAAGTDVLIIPILDDATVTIRIIGVGGECYSTWSGMYLTTGEAWTRWSPGAYQDRWETDDETRWSVVAITSLRGC